MNSSLNPEWEHQFVIPEIAENESFCLRGLFLLLFFFERGENVRKEKGEGEGTYLRYLIVWDEDSMGDDFLGQVFLLFSLLFSLLSSLLSSLFSSLFSLQNSFIGYDCI